MRVLVTGGAGFIGRYVTRALVEAGHETYAFDVNEAFMGKVLNPEVREIAGDITLRLPWSPMPDKLDAVVHLAAMASPGECDRNPAAAFNVNVNGTHNVLMMALQKGVKRVVMASTAHVYGISPRYMPTDERHPLWMQDVYTATKILGEELCRLYYDNHQLNYGVLRLYNGYGPGQPPGYFIPDMIAKASAGSIVLKGGNITKDFVYVEDVARAFLYAVESTYVGPLNVGTGVETRLGDVAGYIAEVKGADFITAENDGVPLSRMRCDNNRAHKVLGWQPVVGLIEGLVKTLTSGGANDHEGEPMEP